MRKRRLSWVAESVRAGRVERDARGRIVRLVRPDAMDGGGAVEAVVREAVVERQGSPMSAPRDAAGARGTHAAGEAERAMTGREAPPRRVVEPVWRHLARRLAGGGRRGT